jgi:hypothetical protein
MHRLTIYNHTLILQINTKFFSIVIKPSSEVLAAMNLANIVVDDQIIYKNAMTHHGTTKRLHNSMIFDSMISVGNTNANTH